MSSPVDQPHDPPDAIAQAPDGGEVLEGFEAALCRYAVEFARALHGGRFREVLADRRAQLRAHVSEYDPPGDVG